MPILHFHGLEEPFNIMPGSAFSLPELFNEFEARNAQMSLCPPETLQDITPPSRWSEGTETTGSIILETDLSGDKATIHLGLANLVPNLLTEADRLRAHTLINMTEHNTLRLPEDSLHYLLAYKPAAKGMRKLAGWYCRPATIFWCRDSRRAPNSCLSGRILVELQVLRNAPT